MGAAPSQPQLKDIGVGRGEDITLSCRSDQGAYFKWKKGDQELEEGDRIHISHNDYKQFYLTITGACDDDGGQYTLELWNYKGKVSGSAYVKLLQYDSDWRQPNWDPRETEARKDKLRQFTLSNSKTTHLRFLIHGPVGHGKSSLIDSFDSMCQGRVTDKALTASLLEKSHTKVYKSYVLKDHMGREMPFVFNDSMGVENGKSGVLTADIITAFKGHVKDGCKFHQDSPLREGDLGYNKHPSLSDEVHCLVSVINADRISAQLTEESDFLTKMREAREAASELTIPNVVLMTHVDTCCPLVRKDLENIYSSKRIKEAMQHCSNKLGVPMKCIFPVKNYHEESAVNTKTDCLLLDALEKIVHFANDYVASKVVPEED